MKPSSAWRTGQRKRVYKKYKHCLLSFDVVTDQINMPKRPTTKMLNTAKMITYPIQPNIMPQVDVLHVIYHLLPIIYTEIIHIGIKTGYPKPKARSCSPGSDMFRGYEKWVVLTYFGHISPFCNAVKTQKFVWTHFANCVDNWKTMPWSLTSKRNINDSQVVCVLNWMSSQTLWI